MLIAYAVNDPKHLEKVVGKPKQRMGSPSPEREQAFVQETWWGQQ